MSGQTDDSAPAAGRPRVTGLPRVAIVGRPNVGKSTLVNRIVGRRAAITQEQPGVTRDRVAYEAEWSRRPFEVIDTGGWEPRATGLRARVVAQAERAMREADLLLFVVDVTTGVTGEDAAIAARLRRGGVPVLLVVNKADDTAAEAQAGGFWSLGLGEPLPVSGLHGRGSGDLLDAVVERLPQRSGAATEAAAPAVAIVGRPNVGKSSLLNRMARAEVAIVDPTPGTTRDTVDSTVDHDGRRYRLVDTAGMRRSFQHADGADYFALVRSFQAVDRADVALLVLESPQGISEQDQKVAVRAVEAGAGLVLVANKWDLMDDEARRRFDLDLERQLHFVGWAPLLRTSARTGRGVDKVWPLIDAVLAARGHRVPTAELNRWLEEATGRTPPPPVRGRSVKVRYVTQARVDPPQFVFFTTGQLTPAYRRYLERDLRRAFGFEGAPLRLVDRVRARQQVGR
ncbi:MAG TPA: ribosome biogenesis GTPase Der [Actinomycetes bacterium]|jgi:GTP-binding protein|nr:ribosome biogenesis GTPase Der [Actinomycetes bacterium]